MQSIDDEYVPAPKKRSLQERQDEEPPERQVRSKRTSAQQTVNYAEESDNEDAEEEVQDVD